jgi:hypothetical protein
MTDSTQLLNVKINPLNKTPIQLIHTDYNDDFYIKFYKIEPLATRNLNIAIFIKAITKLVGIDWKHFKPLTSFYLENTEIPTQFGSYSPIEYVTTRSNGKVDYMYNIVCHSDFLISIQEILDLINTCGINLIHLYGNWIPEHKPLDNKLNFEIGYKEENGEPIVYLKVANNVLFTYTDDLKFDCIASIEHQLAKAYLELQSSFIDNKPPALDNEKATVNLSNIYTKRTGKYYLRKVYDIGEFNAENLSNWITALKNIDTVKWANAKAVKMYQNSYYTSGAGIECFNVHEVSYSNKTYVGKYDSKNTEAIRILCTPLVTPKRTIKSLIQYSNINMMVINGFINDIAIEAGFDCTIKEAFIAIEVPRNEYNDISLEMQLIDITSTIENKLTMSEK